MRAIRKSLIALSIVGATFKVGYSQEYTSLDYRYALNNALSAYVKGINDALNFLEVEANIKIPQYPFWLVLDVSKLSFWRVVILSNLIKEKLGFYPVYLYSIATKQRFLVPSGGKSENDLEGYLRIYRNFYPNVKAYIIKVDNYANFVPVVQLRMCAKGDNSIDNVVQALEIAKGIAKEKGDETLANYLKKVIRQIKLYLQSQVDESF